MEKRELVIIGAGPAGLSAAIYGKRAGLDTLVLEKGRPGGQILTTSRVENYPGIIDGTGTGLADAFRAHAEFFKAEFRSASVQKLEVRGDQKIITLKDGSEIAAGAVIVATGAYFRKQGCPGEKKYTGMGVSYCAVCDGNFYRGRDVAVVGGGTMGRGIAISCLQAGLDVVLLERDSAALAQAVAAIEQHGAVDAVLQYFGAGQGAILGHVAHHEDGDMILLGIAGEQGRRFAHLGDGAGG